MKIQCDVCEKEEASVFCTADEAPLCVRCDSRVHRANKLAGKHIRLPLLPPSSSTDYPHCDICQKRRGLLFCQEDRAILCRECDIPIHKANQHTEKHSRFLLSGIKLSANKAINHSTETDVINSVSSSNSTLHYSTTIPNQEVDFHHHRQKNTSLSNDGASGSTSSISEYLMETLPGWHVDDFLDPSSSSPYGFCKSYNDDILPYTEVENNIGSVSYEHLRVPKSESYHNIQFQDWNGQKMEGSEVNSSMRQYLKYENNFEVPYFI